MRVYIWRLNDFMSVHLESDGVHIMRVYTYYCKISRGNFERHPQTLK